MQVRIVVNTV